MSKATKGMGMSGGLSKHRKAGKAPKSPKLRHRLELEAQKNERKAPTPLTETSVKHLFEDNKTS